MDYMVDEPVPRSNRRRFGLAAAMILAVVGCHFGATFVCFQAAANCSFMGSGGEDEQNAEIVCWLSGLGFIVLSFPLGWLLYCSSIGGPKMFFAIMAANSLFWGCLFYLRYYFMKHAP